MKADDIRSKNDMPKFIVSRQFSGYLVASAMAFCVDYFAYWALAYAVKISLPLAAVCGYSAGLFAAYFLVSDKVIKHGWLRHRRGIEIMLFAFSGVVGMTMTYVTVWLYVTFLGSDLHASKLLAVALSFFSVYAFRKYVVFRSAEKHEPSDNLSS